MISAHEQGGDCFSQILGETTMVQQMRRRAWPGSTWDGAEPKAPGTFSRSRAHTPDHGKSSLRVDSTGARIEQKLFKVMVALCDYLAHTAISLSSTHRGKSPFPGTKLGSGIYNFQTGQSTCSKPWNVTCPVLSAYGP